MHHSLGTTLFLGGFLLSAALSWAQQFPSPQAPPLRAQTSSQGITIFAVPMSPGWPVTLAASVPSTLRLSGNATFAWSFPSASGNPSCTANGRSRVSPCHGRVVDYTFVQPGRHTVTLRVTDSTLPQPATATIEIDIPSTPSSTVQAAQRPEIRSIPLQVWTTKYVPAFYAIKSLTVYEHFARIHRATFDVGTVPGSASSRSSAHSSPAFLPWHRVLMRLLERALQVAANDPTLGLPYWDWQQGWEGIAPYMGGSGDPQDHHVVKDGPFGMTRWALPSDYPEPVKALSRNLGGAAPGFQFLSQAELERLLALPSYDLPPFDNRPTPNSFRNAVEGWLNQQDTQFSSAHNGVHRWIAGTMGNVLYSFHDPLFHIHHAQVDRLFMKWQAQHQCTDGRGTPTCYRPGVTDPDVNVNLLGAQQQPLSGGVVRNGTNATTTTRFALVGQMFNDALFPWSLRIQDVLATQSLGYVYLEPGQVASTQPGGNGTFGSSGSGVAGNVADVSALPDPKGLNSTSDASPIVLETGPDASNVTINLGGSKSQRNKNGNANEEGDGNAAASVHGWNWKLSTGLAGIVGVWCML